VSDTPPITDALLRDIHMPAQLSNWWPLAYGWWIVLGVLGCILLYSGYKFYHHYIVGRAKRHALQVLLSYENAYHQNKNASHYCAQLSELLRRVALVYFPREQVAGLHGMAWINFLNQTSNNTLFTDDTLLTLPYTNNTCLIDLTPLFNATRQWIKQRNKPCLN